MNQIYTARHFYVDGPIPSQTLNVGVTINNSKKIYGGYWDTGATNTVISEKVIRECNLQSTGETAQFHVVGSDDGKESPLYLIKLGIEGLYDLDVTAISTQVTPPHDVMIGLDVIKQGDFAITSEGESIFVSFRVPSTNNKIDFGFQINLDKDKLIEKKYPSGNYSYFEYEYTHQTVNVTCKIRIPMLI